MMINVYGIAADSILINMAISRTFKSPMRPDVGLDELEALIMQAKF